MAKGDFQKASGVIPWEEWDELPEDVIRRLRDDECYCDECNAVRCNYPGWSRVWKQVAKKHWVLSNKKWWLLYDTQAESDRRGALLKRAVVVLEPHLVELIDDIEKELADE